jgi:rhodanese-related sulfurtransferase
VLAAATFSCAAGEVAEISCEDMARFDDAVLVDVREQAEWEGGHIQGAMHVPLSALQKDIFAFTPPESGKTCILYCQRGMRSRRAAELLRAAGVENVVSLKGGFEAWRARRES